MNTWTKIHCEELAKKGLEKWRYEFEDGEILEKTVSIIKDEQLGTQQRIFLSNEEAIKIFNKTN